MANLLIMLTKVIPITILIGVLSGCGLVPPKPHPEIDSQELSRLKENPIAPNYRRLNICGGRSYVISSIFGRHEGWVQAKNLTYTVSKKDASVLAAINYDEMAIIDLPSEATQLDISYKDSVGNVKESALNLPADREKNIYVAINRVADGRNFSCYPVGSGGAVTCDGGLPVTMELIPNPDSTTCENKKVVKYARY